ncbi:uncharacterized protein HMPREF1541_05007 [Cyphellophora europaea CBS 101466]|uniref:SAP domain-containing protein n=1 Tax=Cyphellophora europaea (strain CBS 101466) TaxID=1220924 RepID=W2RWA3_CYPE1|nr:uncharacterized protein HMPREF1541_05007 [Cyphellophora europaea CBS 101466]ETN40727.1 hypothetical protein HMPREF1541_05007 [Cyphellophora europaea CBS 101466]
MTNWSKLKVVDLKAECAQREIPLTGLKLKQQYIDKLEEWEAAQGQGQETDAVKQSPALANGEPSITQPEVEQQTAQETQSIAQADDGQKTQIIDEAPASGDLQPQAEIKETQNSDAPPNLQEQAAPTQETEQINSEQVAPLLEEQQAATEREAPAETNIEQPAVSVAEHTDREDATAGSTEAPTSDFQQPAPAPILDETPLGVSASIPPTGDTTRSSSGAPPVEVMEDARKRKRRSVTPTPKAEEVALKRIKANDGSPLLRAQEEAIAEQKAIDEAGVDADAGPLAKDQPVAEVELQSGPLSQQGDKASLERSASPVSDHPVVPALHPATSTLYIRNFKRPLRQPDLQAHIASLARASRDEPDSNPIKFFYLDVIRTHAFVRLQSIVSASRVRSALHGTRWPDEPNRELLWVDFIPDDKAETWANQEADASAGSGFGGRGGGGKRWEVVYQDGSNGVEARLQDANEARRGPRQQRSSFSQPGKPSIHLQQDLMPGVHPDRAAYVPRADARRGSKPYDDRPLPPRQPKHAERNFAALDELFSSTERTKPKLYYKPVAPEVVDRRLEMMKDMRVGHNDMGRSGDEGMKRYSFEWDRGRVEWVDKGPEFGFGRKGRERLMGDRGGRGGGGGFRGRGGGGMGRPPRGPSGGYQDWDAPPPGRRDGDSWRGGR